MTRNLRWLIGTALTLFLFFLAAQMSPIHDIVVAADLWCGQFLFAARTPLLLHAFGWVTMLGNIFIVAGIAGVTLLFILNEQTLRRYAAGLCVSIVGAVITDYALKMLVGRPRPGAPISAAFEPSFSFPSGHAAAAVALYGFIAYILCTLFPTWKKIILSLALLFIMGIGLSRLYLGVHFLSDILAGYALGCLWLLMGIEIARRKKDAPVTP